MKKDIKDKLKQKFVKLEQDIENKFKKLKDEYDLPILDDMDVGGQGQPQD